MGIKSAVTIIKQATGKFEAYFSCLIWLFLQRLGMSLSALTSSQIQEILQLLEERKSIESKLQKVFAKIDKLARYEAAISHTPAKLRRKRLRRGGLKKAILGQLQAAGKPGVSAQEIAASIGANSRTFAWDAKNQLVKITYADTSYSQFTYNGAGERVKIQEYDNTGSHNLTSTKQYVWAGGLAEERDVTNTVTKRYFGQGEQRVVGGTATNYFYTRDHLGSIREMIDSSGTIQARYSYDPYGRRTKVSGALDCDFGFTGHYWHATSSLYLAPYRAYDPNLGRWISRDPLTDAEFNQGPNLYQYGFNNPINNIDPTGTIVPLIIALLSIGGGINAVANGVQAYYRGESAGQIVQATARGFVSGVVGTGVGTAVTVVSKSIPAGAAAGSAAASISDNVLEGKSTQEIVSNAIISAISGSILGPLVSKIPGLETVGRLPNLLSARSLSDYGPNSMRQIGQEALNDLSGALIPKFEIGGGSSPTGTGCM